jgi:hypothetical protein
MKKILVLGLGLGLALACSFANANYVKVKTTEFSEEAYQTTRPVVADYLIYYSNFFEEDENTEVFPDPDKNGLYVEASVKLMSSPSTTFPKAPLTITNDLLAALKINESTLVQKFKGVSKKTPYYCIVKGKMIAQLTVQYDGRNYMRFTRSLTGEVKSATKIDQPRMTCNIA